jgi:hypothetical protein
MRSEDYRIFNGVKASGQPSKYHHRIFPGLGLGAVELDAHLSQPPGAGGVVVLHRGDARRADAGAAVLHLLRGRACPGKRSELVGEAVDRGRDHRKVTSAGSASPAGRSWRAAGYGPSSGNFRSGSVDRRIKPKPNEVEGATYWRIMRFIILPQAVRNVLPALGNEFIAILKIHTGIRLGVQDITQLGKMYSASTFKFFETYNVVAFLYLVMTITLSLGVGALERRLSQHRT